MVPPLLLRDWSHLWGSHSAFTTCLSQKSWSLKALMFRLVWLCIVIFLFNTTEKTLFLTQLYLILMSCRYSSLDSWLSCSILWTMLCLACPVLTNFHSQQPFADLSPPCFTPPDCFLVFSHQLSLFAFASIFHGVSGAALLWKLLTQQPQPHPCFTPSHPAVGKKTKTKTITAATVVVDIFWSRNFFFCDEFIICTILFFCFFCLNILLKERTHEWSSLILRNLWVAVLMHSQNTTPTLVLLSYTLYLCLYYHK